MGHRADLDAGRTDGQDLDGEVMGMASMVMPRLPIIFAPRVIVVSMMPSAAAFDGDQPVSASTPREIRAALTGEEIGHFDREYRRAMAEAAESLDLSGVVSMLRRWRRVAWSTQDDPDAHRHMLACADNLNMGGAVVTESWQQTKARLGL
jgi:Family of unknown function (DUF6247)